MMDNRRWVGFAVGGLGALVLCMALPMLDPACAAPLASVPGFAGCGATWPITWRVIPSVALALVGVTGAGVLGSVAIQAVAHHRVSRALRRAAQPATLAGQAVALVPGMAAACVAGIRKPTIYCSADLDSQLDDDELRAVLLHEQHHQLTHAPARLVVMAGLAAVVSPIETARGWLEHRRADIEIAADRHAISSGAERSVLARALLKLDSRSPSLSVVGFTTALDLRLRALLGQGPTEPAQRRPAPMTLAAGACLVAVVCRLGPLL